MTVHFIATIAILMFIAGILCIVGLLGGGWIAGAVLIVVSFIPGGFAALLWSDMTNV